MNPVLALLHRLDPERAHNLALLALRRPRLARLFRPQSLPSLPTEAFGLQFANPIGLAAGFDKSATAVAGLFALGFGFVEVGTVTPRPRRGNPRPRLWRLPAQQSLCNNMGLNNAGMEAVAARLPPRPRPGILGINIGAETDPSEYVDAARRLAPLADYLALNISCPNISKGRCLQDSNALEDLLHQVNAVRAQTPLLLKLAPDIAPDRQQFIASLALAGLVDGLIVANTMPSDRPAQPGGVSGRLLLQPATETLRQMSERTEGRIPLIASGGVFSAADARAKLRAGAILVQIYTAFTYQGPAVIADILNGLQPAPGR